MGKTIELFKLEFTRFCFRRPHRGMCLIYETAKKNSSAEHAFVFIRNKF